jgi:hypothetical protein
MNQNCYYNPSIDPQQRMSEVGVSDITTLSINTLQQMRVNGDGPKYHKLGRKVVYKRVDVLDWLEAYESVGKAS